MAKEDLNNFVEENEEDEVFWRSEEFAFEWIENFMADINSIESFFKEKKKGLIDQFIQT